MHRFKLRQHLSLLTIVLVAALSLFGKVSLVRAEAGQGITISPAATQISIKPGGSLNKKISVTNGGTIDYDVTVSVAPYRVVGLDYDPKFTLLPGATEVTSWVSVNDSVRELKAGATTVFDYTVSIPSNTPPGGYYAVLFAITGLDSTDAQGITAVSRVGNILYITVEGTVKAGGEFTGEPLGRYLFQEEILVSARISNTGGTHYTTNVTYTYKGVTGKTLRTSKFERIILPQTERRITDTWRPSWPIGIYTISRSATVAGEKQTLPDIRVFFIRPWLLITALIVIAAAALWLSSRVYIRRHKKAK